MTKTIAQRELRNDSAKVMDAVVAGESFVVTRNGVPVAELRPIATARRTFVTKADAAKIFSAGPRIDRRQFRADSDRQINQSL